MNTYPGLWSGNYVTCPALKLEIKVREGVRGINYPVLVYANEKGPYAVKCPGVTNIEIEEIKPL